MKREHSLIRRVLIRIVAVTLLYSAGMAALIYEQIDNTLFMLRDKTLTESAHDIASYMEKADEVLIFDMPLASKNFYTQAGRFYQYVVKDEKGQPLFHSPIAFLDRYSTYIPDENEPYFFEFSGPYGTHFLGVTLTVNFEGEKYVVQVAQSEESAEAFSDLLTSTFLEKISIFGLPFLGLLIVIIVASIRKSLYTLNESSRQASAISFERPDVRLNETGLPVEIKPLVHAVNSALERMERGIVAQKEFTANAAHELRTPLAILRSHIDLLDDRETVRKLARDIDTMSRLVSQLLDAARLDMPEALPMEEINLAAAVKDVCTATWPLVMKEGRDMEVYGIHRTVPARGHYDSIFRALRNLIDNAMNHTAPGTAIEIHVETDGSVRVRDHGPGISGDQKEKIFDRFWRKDTSGNDGSGLGLSIVRKTMELHRGTVRVEDAADGGSVFILQFPSLPAR